MRQVLSGPRRARRHSAALAAVAIAVAQGVSACQAAAARPTATRPAPSHTLRSGRYLSPRAVASLAGQASDASPRIMIVGDSITNGSAGDYTWQYRLYEHLLADGVEPQMVGPYGWLYDNVTHAERVESYADPNFEHANDAAWGMALFREKDAIRGKVATYRPDYLLVLLGLNDLFWFFKSQPAMAENLASFVAAARAARPHIRIVLGLIPPDIHERSPAFAANVAAYNRTISATAARMSTNESPIAIAFDGSGINIATDLWDGTHPNANGEIKIAAAFADVLAGRFNVGQAYEEPYLVMPTGPLTHPLLMVRPSLTKGEAVLSWTHSPGADSYFIYLKDVTSGATTFTRLPFPLRLAKDPFTAGLLSSGDTYTFEVQACKGVDCSAFSNPASVIAP